MSEDIQTYIDMLESADANQRKQAIIILGKSGDKRALKPLAKVYQSDPDASLRELARKAGRHIQKENAVLQSSMDGSLEAYHYDTGGATSAPAFITDDGTPATTEDIPAWMQQMGATAEKPPKKVTDKDRKKAKALVDRAIDAQMHGDMEKIVDLLADAIEINPETEKDTIVLGLLSQATNMDGAVAIAELKRIAAEDAAAGKKRKRSSDLNWGETIDFLVEMAIWALVLSLIAAGGLFLTLNDLDWEAAKAEARAEGATAEEIEFYDSAEDFFDEYGPLTALIGGFIYGGMITAATVFMSFLTWFVGATWLGGSGMIYPFLQAMMRVLILVLFISPATSILSRFFAPGSDAAILLGFAPLVLGIGITGWTIGRVHEFGIAMGCLNMIGTVVACSLMSCGCGYLTSL